MFAASVAASSAYRKRGRVKDESEEEQLHSALACLLVAWTAWGVLSGPQAQKLAEAAVEDGLDAPSLRKIALAGNSGAWKQNCKRDVFSGSDYGKRIPVSQIKLPVKVARAADEANPVAWKLHPIILPHSWFHFLVTVLPERFEALISGLREFWAGAPEGDPRIPPAMAARQDSAVPLLLHFDGARYSHAGDSMESLQWSFVNCGKRYSQLKNTWDTMCLIICVCKDAVCKSANEGISTWETAYSSICASFNCLMISVFLQNNCFWA